MAKIETLFVAGDTAPDLTGTVTSAGAPVDLTGATVVLRMQRPDGTILLRTATVTAAAAGTWSYVWQAGELVKGQWQVDVEVTGADGLLQTTPAPHPIMFDVRGRLSGGPGSVTPPPMLDLSELEAIRDAATTARNEAVEAREATEAVLPSLSSTYVARRDDGTLSDEHLPKADPSGQLAWVTTGTGWDTGLPLSPRSIGVDGWVYGQYNNTQMWRSGDGLATRDLSAQVFTGKQVLWVSRVQEGYVALIVNAPSPATGDGELWFSPDWETGWVLRKSIGPVRVLSCPRPRRGPHGTVLLVGEYANNAVSPTLLKLWLSVDGGQNWRAVRDTNGTTAGYSSHWHQADYDPKRQRIWAVNGDGPNAWTGFSDDYGDTWEDSPFPDGHPLHSTVPGANHNKSTMLLIMGDSVHMCPDHDAWPTGIWTMDIDRGTPSTVIRQEVPVATPPSGALQWAVGSLVAQHGMEAYVSFPPNGSTDTNAYILGTGDNGRSWHLVSTIALGTGTAQAGIIGPDKHGYLYFKGYGTTAFGDLIARAHVLDWTWRNHA